MDLNNIQIEQPRVGMTVQPTQDPLTGEYGQHIVSSNDVLANEHKFQEFQRENDLVNPEAYEPQDKIDDDLVNAFTEVNPDTFKAIAYANQFMSDEAIAEWNSKVDNSDWFQLAPVLEQWLEEYRAAGSPDIEENRFEDEPEITQQQVDQEYNQLLESEPEGIDQAGELLSEAEQQMQQGNNLAAEMLMNASRFHSGSMTAQEAIDAVMNSGYSHDEIISTYYSLFN